MKKTKKASRNAVEEIHFKTARELDWRDITADVRERVRQAGYTFGMVNVFVPGSTGSVVLIEAEKGLLDDLLRICDEVVPREREYEHEKRWHDGNGHSHLRATLCGESVSVPIFEGELALGAWQQIVFIEFDIHPRNRRLIVSCTGAS